MRVDEAARALDATTRRALPVIFLGVGGFYAALVAGTPFIDPEGRPGAPLIACWVATAALGLAGAAALYRRPVPTGWSNHVAGALGVLTVLDSLLLVEQAGPQFLFAIIVALVAFAMFLLSLRWVVVLCLIALAGFLLLTVGAGGGIEWTPRAISLFAFCVLALVVQAMRLGMMRRLARMTARAVEHEAEQHTLREAQALMEQRQRIVNVTAHELGTPMTPMLVATHLLAKSDLRPDQRKHVETLQRNMARLQETVRRVREAASADDKTEALFAGETEKGGFAPEVPSSTAQAPGPAPKGQA